MNFTMKQLSRKIENKILEVFKNDGITIDTAKNIKKFLNIYVKLYLEELEIKFDPIDVLEITYIIVNNLSEFDSLREAFEYTVEFYFELKEKNLEECEKLTKLLDNIMELKYEPIWNIFTEIITMHYRNYYKHKYAKYLIKKTKYILRKNSYRKKKN